MRHRLIPHPLTPCEAVTRLDVEVGRDGIRLALRYVLMGDLGRLAIPGRAPPARIDGLWDHTCFEAFVAGHGAGYQEFNFSPSGAWAAYGFDGYRQGMAPMDVPAPRIGTATTADALELRVELSLPSGLTRLGLTAVVEEVGGRLSYWALRHPAERPDFHDAEGFALEV